MAYISTIAGTDRIKNTRPQLQTNFTDIQTWTAVDHATFGTPNEGKHNQVTLPVNAAAAPAAGEMKIWANTYAPTAQPEVFIANGTAGTSWPLTAGLANTNGYTFLPNGLLMKWGTQTQNVTTGGPFTYTFNADVPFTAIYWAIANVAATNNPGQDVNAVSYITNIATPAQLQYRVWRRNLYNTAGTDHPPFSVFILAIGKP